MTYIKVVLEFCITASYPSAAQTYKKQLEVVQDSALPLLPAFAGILQQICYRLKVKYHLWLFAVPSSLVSTSCCKSADALFGMQQRACKAMAKTAALVAGDKSQRLGIQHLLQIPEKV